jgi:hypothetical protein
MLSDDDIDLAQLTDEELALAWDLWFDLAQATNDDDPPYTHGVFQLVDDAQRGGTGFAPAGTKPGFIGLSP